MAVVPVPVPAYRAFSTSAKYVGGLGGSTVTNLAAGATPLSALSNPDRDRPHIARLSPSPLPLACSPSWSLPQVRGMSLDKERQACTLACKAVKSCGLGERSSCGSALSRYASACVRAPRCVCARACKGRSTHKGEAQCQFHFATGFLLLLECILM